MFSIRFIGIDMRINSQPLAEKENEYFSAVYDSLNPVFNKYSIDDFEHNLVSSQNTPNQ